ncbi:hypothetical protein WR00_13935 [Escherichia coli]|nr:hypothetical protein PU62_19070 [Escherichia coli]KLG66973.1 hypothetical protein WR00_13935 [Escherichia coli]
MQHPDYEDYRHAERDGRKRFLRHSACSFVGEALTYHLLKVDMLGPRLNRDVFRGLSTSGLRVFPPTISRKAPARNLSLFCYSGNSAC